MTDLLRRNKATLTVVAVVVAVAAFLLASGLASWGVNLGH